MKRILIDTYSVTDRLERAYAFAVGEAREAFREALEIVLDAPEVAAQEVERGEWRETGEPLGWEGISTVECSICGDVHILDRPLKKFERLYRYCPHCGAKMDGAA